MEPEHPKQDFQVERIAFFSDAVFAIALTLLIIEFKPPHIVKDTTSEQLWEQMGDLKYTGSALLISFMLIINFWMRHHTLFKHVHNYNKPIVVTNMMLLLPIIFFPFAAAFLYDSVNSDNPLVIIPIRVFFIVTFSASAILYVLYYLIIKKYPHCSYPMNETDKREFNVELPLMTITFFIVVALSFFSVKLMYWCVLPYAIYNVYKKYLSRWRKKGKAPVTVIPVHK